jgi:hypothetical protein
MERQLTLDKETVAYIEQAIRALRKEAPNRFTPRRVLTMISLIAGAVVSLGTAVIWSMNTFTTYGWVTRAEFTRSEERQQTSFEVRTEYLQDRAQNEARADRQEAEIKAAQANGNEILAYVKIVPQIKVLIKIRCTGNPDVQSTIDGLKKQYLELTGSPYVEPRCDDPEIRATAVR